jgi:hypothetical protein
VLEIMKAISGQAARDERSAPSHDSYFAVGSAVDRSASNASPLVG